MIQRVFFDLGLTLAESDVPQGYVEHLARLGHPVSLEEAQRAYHLANKFSLCGSARALWARAARRSCGTSSRGSAKSWASPSWGKTFSA